MIKDNSGLKDSILIGQLLIEEGVVTPEQLEVGLSKQEETGEFICAVLARLGFVKEELLCGVLSRQLNIPYVNLRNNEVSLAAIEKVPARFAINYKIFPVDLKDGVITIAMVDPLDLRILDDIKFLSGLQVRGVLAGEAEVQEMIHRHYFTCTEMLDKIVAEGENLAGQKSDFDQTEDVKIAVEDSFIIKFVNHLLSEAIESRATDIHIEPFRRELRIRFRIDGLLYDMNVPDTIKRFHSAIISRIKIMAQMNIAERRLPQDGRIRIKGEGYKLDLRVSTMPTVFGEAVQIRILSSGFFLTLDKIGLEGEELNIIEGAIKKPHGVIFVTGPTGSGKSTTLYACLTRINSERIKIITIEDPVEYQIKGLVQVPINNRIGFNFSNALKAMLRHDPDVIMVGEVRDYETAEIAIRSALTGHLVLSTLHTNDAAGAITRLLDMGVEPYLLSSSLACVVAQRLIRILCPGCKIPLSPDKKKYIARQIKKHPGVEEMDLYEEKGCRECRFTGYRGRTGIYEVFRVNEQIRKLIISRASSQRISEEAVVHGMRGLREQGLNKFFLGLTTFTEIMRVTQQEDIPEF